MTVLVRPATEADEPVLRAIEQGTMTFAASPAPAPEDAAFFRGRLRPADVLVAEDAGAVVGYVSLEQSWDAPAHRHVIDIAGLGVAPTAQGSGLGRVLVTAAVEEARQRGYRKVALRVLAPNTPARRIYEACGFEVEGVLREEFRIEGRYVDDVLMARDLN